MKISLFPALLSLILTAALTFLAYTMAGEEEYVNLLAVGTAISVLSTLGVSMAAKFDNPKVGLSIKAWCVVMFLILFGANLCFAWLGVNAPYYVVTITFFLIIHLLVVWKVSSIKNV